MGLRFDPIGGGQFKQALKQIIEVEQEPVRKLEGKKSIQETRLKLFQEFKGKLGALQASVTDMSSFDKFIEYKIELGEGAKLMDVTVDKGKVKQGSYLVEVDSVAERSSMISNMFTDPDEPVMGIGFVMVHLPDGDTWEAFVDYEDSSLTGIANVINNNPDSPIRASVVKDAYDPDKQWRIMLSAKKDGFNNGVEFPEFYFLDGEEPFWTNDDHDSANGVVFIDNFEVETDSNDVTDFLQGVNIHLKQASPGQPFIMKIEEDRKKISGKVEDLVKKTNEVLEFINLQNKVDEKSDTKTTFTGDTSLQAIEYRLRNVFHEGFPTGDLNSDQFRLMHLHELGISFNRVGLITVNSEKLTQAMERDFDRVAEAFTGELGFATQLGRILGGYTRGFDGMLVLREKGMRNQIDQIDRQIESKERQIAQKTEMLTRKFSKLQGALGNLQQQQAALSATIGSAGGGNMIQQLLG